MKCPTCESCEYEQYCGATEIMRKCERHNKKVEQTNEEWFNQLTTYDKAKWIFYQIYYVTKCDVYSENRRDWSVKDWEMWLKQPHNRKDDD